MRRLLQEIDRLQRLLDLPLRLSATTPARRFEIPRLMPPSSWNGRKREWKTGESVEARLGSGPVPSPRVTRGLPVPVPLPRPDRLRQSPSARPAAVSLRSRTDRGARGRRSRTRFHQTAPEGPTGHEPAGFPREQ